MIDYEKEFGKPGYAAGARQVQIAATFKIVYGWMCAGLAGRDGQRGACGRFRLAE